MRHRKATTVAHEMGLTQPAVSHALKRLRNLYDDPLFLRRAHGLEPTALAHELEPKVRRIVRLISETLEGLEDFDPKTVATNLRIGAFDYELTGIIPQLVTELSRVSPNISVHAFPLQNHQALEALAQGQIDLAIGYFDFRSKVKTPMSQKSYIRVLRIGWPKRPSSTFRRVDFRENRDRKSSANFSVWSDPQYG